MTIEKKAIDTLLENGIKFKVRTRVLGFVLNIPFRIKPLHLGTILHLAKQRTKISKMENPDNVLWEMFDKAENVKVFARCSAIAVLRTNVRIKLFSYLLSQFFLWNLTVKEVHDIMTVVTTQMNARDFFFTTALVKGFEIVAREKPDTSQSEQSGEQSERYQKS